MVKRSTERSAGQSAGQSAGPAVLAERSAEQSAERSAGHPVSVLVVRRAKTTWHIYQLLCQQIAPPRSAVRTLGEPERVASAPSLVAALAAGEALAIKDGCMLVVPTEQRRLEARCPVHGLFRTNTSETYAFESAVEHWSKAHVARETAEEA